MHGKSITQDIVDGLEAYKQEEFDKFGKIMGNMLKIATQFNADKGIQTSPFKQDISPEEKREKVTEIYQGFLEGMGVGTFNFTDLLLCIYEADQTAIAVYEGVNLIEEAWQKKD